MFTESEGIVLRQVKAVNGRRMITIFTSRYGKISAGTSISEGGKNKAALAIRPFTYGKYSLYKTAESYNISSAQVIESYYSLGEDFDKYLAASYALELTDKVLPEDVPQPKIFLRLSDFMKALSERNTKHDTLVIAYMVKLLEILGAYPDFSACAHCGKAIKGAVCFSVSEGGMMCEECAKKNIEIKSNERLIYRLNFGIVDIMNYFKSEPFEAFSRIALDDEISDVVKRLLKEYYRYHFDIGMLKSEELEV